MKRFCCLIIIVICVLAQGCSVLLPKQMNYTMDLPGGYGIYCASNESVSIYNHSKDGNGYSIGTKIIQVGWNEDYIIVKRMPLNLEYISKLGSDSEIQEYINSIKEENMEYWIIEVDKDKYYRFLSQERFEEKKRELNLPDTLKLHPLEDYKNYFEYEDKDDNINDNSDEEAVPENLLDVKDKLTVINDEDIVVEKNGDQIISKCNFSIANNEEYSVKNVTYKVTFYNSGQVIYSYKIPLDGDIIKPGDKASFIASCSGEADDLKIEIIRGES